MRNKKGNILVIFLAVALIVSVSATGYLFVQNKQLQNQTTETPTQTQVATPAPTLTPTPDPTADWKTYANNVFSVKIPTDWIIGNNSNWLYSDGQKIGGVTPPCSYSIYPDTCFQKTFSGPVTFSLNNKPVNELLYDPVKCTNSNAQMVDGCPELVENKTLVLGSNKVFWQILNGAPAGERLEILIPKNDKETVGILHFYHLPKSSKLDRKFLPTIEQILSTFKFL